MNSQARNDSGRHALPPPATRHGWLLVIHRRKNFAAYRGKPLQAVTNRIIGDDDGKVVIGIAIQVACVIAGRKNMATAKRIAPFSFYIRSTSMNKLSIAIFASLCTWSAGSFAQDASGGITESTDPQKIAAVEQHAQQLAQAQTATPSDATGTPAHSKKHGSTKKKSSGKSKSSAASSGASGGSSAAGAPGAAGSGGSSGSSGGTGATSGSSSPSGSSSTGSSSSGSTGATPGSGTSPGTTGSGTTPPTGNPGGGGSSPQ